MNVDLMSVAGSAMDAQRAALDVTARNVAAAQAAGPHHDYARMIPEFRVVRGLVEFVGARQQRGAGIDVLAEMIAAMNASRAYEADASLFDVGKTLAEKTIDLGRL